MKTSPVLRSLAAIALIGSALQCAIQAGDKAQAAGTWKWSTQTRDGQTRESILTLKQDGDKLTGVIKGAQAENPIQEGKIRGDEITFKVERETQRGQVIASYKGKIEGDTIKGAISTKTGEQTRDREWVAKRDGAVDIAGDWAWVMKRDNGETWDATLKLKRDGDSITGQFEREGLDFKIEVKNAKLSGSILTFETVMERDGQSTTIKSSAELQGKMMKGKAQGTRDGEPWTREWEATRK